MDLRRLSSALALAIIGQRFDRLVGSALNGQMRHDQLADQKGLCDGRFVPSFKVFDAGHDFLFNFVIKVAIRVQAIQ